MYWGLQDASISFCEKDYEQTDYIAEFYNTYSSLIYVLTGAALLKTKVHTLAIGLMFVGFGSVILHGTMRYYGQIIDELSMMTLSYLVLNYIKKKYKIVYLIPLYIFYLFTYTNFIFFFCSFCLSILLIIYHCSKYKCENNEFYIYAFCMFFLSGSVCWLGDQFLCEYTQEFNLHALWHLFTCFGIFCGFIFLSKINLKKD